MKEPAIIACGRSVTDYSEQEFKESLFRAFKENGADFVTLDSNLRHQRFLSACAAWAIDNGYLYNDASESSDCGNESVYSFRLTDAGKKAICDWLPCHTPHTS